MKLLFDLGATKTRLALANAKGGFDDPLVIDTDPTAGGQAQFMQAVRQVVGDRQLTLAAGGAAGTVNRTKGILLDARNLEWGKVDLGGLFRQAFKARIVLENDTAVVGLGEAYHGAGVIQGIMAYITVSTGVNAARLVDGQIDTSTYGFEFGRQVVKEVNGRPVTLEDLIGGHAMQRRYGRLPRGVDDPRVWQQETHNLAVAIYNLILTWSPEVIVFGGSMMRDIPLDWLRQDLEGMTKVFPRLPELRLAKLQAEGGLYGALELIKEVG